MYGCGFSPKLLGSLFAWYDASKLVGANGSNVPTWNDLSGNGRTLTASATNPTLKTQWSNGLNAVTSATATYYQSAGGLSAYAVSSGVTVFSACQYADLAVNRTAWDISTVDTQIFGDVIASGDISINWNGVSITVADSTLLNPTVVDCGYSYSPASPFNMRMFVNGNKIADGSGPAVAANVLDKFTILNNNALGQGGITMGELLIYNSRMTDVNIARVREYLRNKWGTP